MATKEYEQIPEGVMDAALAQLGQRPTYAGTFEQQIKDTYDRIVNRQPFRYDTKEDPLYQSYKDQYVQQGKLAMKDSMGQAAALTGGYGSTYAQSVGQQTYDAYLQSLSAVIPELYGKAYDKYQDEGDALAKQYALLGDQRDAEYGKYRDELGDWENERAYQKQLETETYNRGVAEDEREYQRQQDAYKKEQDALAQKQKNYSTLYAIIAASGYSPTDEELAAAGMTRQAADAVRAEYQRGIDMQNEQLALQRESLNARSYSSGGGGGRSGGGYSSGGGSDYYDDYSDYEGVYQTILSQRKAAEKVDNENKKKGINTTSNSALEGMLTRAAANGGKIKTTR